MVEKAKRGLKTIATEHAADFVHDTVMELGRLRLEDIPTEEMVKMPNLSVLLGNVKEHPGFDAEGQPWLNAMDKWYPNWGYLLKVGGQAAITWIKEARIASLLNLAHFIDDQFRYQVFSLAEKDEANGRDPKDWWFYQLKNEFLRETVVKGPSLMPGQNVYFLDCTYAFKRMTK